MYAASQLPVSRRGLQKYAGIGFGLFGVVLFVALLQLVGVPTFWEPDWHRAATAGMFSVVPTSIFGQHTLFGSAMAVALCMSLGLAALYDRRKFGSLSVAFFFAVVLSTVRRVLLGIPAALCLTPVFLRERKINQRRRFGRLIPVLVVLILTAVVFLPQFKRGWQDARYQYYVTGHEEPRLILYGAAFRILGESPLLGAGPGQLGSWPSVLYDSPLYEQMGLRMPEDQRMGAPYATFLAEFGIAGTLAYVWALLELLRMLRKLYRGFRDPFLKGLTAGVTVLYFDLVVESLAHYSFQDSFVGFWFFGALGVLLAQYRQAQATENILPKGLIRPAFQHES